MDVLPWLILLNTLSVLILSHCFPCLSLFYSQKLLFCLSDTKGIYLNKACSGFEPESPVRFRISTWKADKNLTSVNNFLAVKIFPSLYTHVYFTGLQFQFCLHVYGTSHFYSLLPIFVYLFLFSCHTYVYSYFFFILLLIYPINFTLLLHFPLLLHYSTSHFEMFVTVIVLRNALSV